VKLTIQSLSLDEVNFMAMITRVFRRDWMGNPRRSADKKSRQNNLRINPDVT
jgi:hypothetical protein